MGDVSEDSAAEVVELFACLFGVAADVEDFDAGEAAAVVEGGLGECGVGLAGPAGAAEADLGGAVGQVAEACGGVELELSGLGEVAGGNEVFDLLGRTVEMVCGSFETGDFVNQFLGFHRRTCPGFFQFPGPVPANRRWRRSGRRRDVTDVGGAGGRRQF